MHGPPGWQAFATLWALPDDEANTFWRALTRARTSRAIALRHAAELLIYRGEPQATLYAAVEQALRVWPPVRVVAVLEALVWEGWLSRRQATQLEERILSVVTNAGRWSADAPAVKGRCSVHPPDVVPFAEYGNV